MPAVARQLGVDSLAIVPYYYVPAALGEAWQREIRETLGAEAFSWRGFHHENSGVDPAEFAAQHRRYVDTLQDLHDYPYMPLTLDQYRVWFTDPAAPVGPPGCANIERLIDIQPGGEANFCVDFPDASLGNVRQASIASIWNGESVCPLRLPSVLGRCQQVAEVGERLRKRGGEFGSVTGRPRRTGWTWREPVPDQRLYEFTYKETSKGLAHSVPPEPGTAPP